MELETVETIVRQGTDGLAVHIVNDDMFDDIMAECIEGGQICLATNVDDSEGAAGNARLSMNGQDLYRAGYELVKGLAPKLPDGHVHVLFGLSAPGQSWAEARINSGIDVLVRIRLHFDKEYVHISKVLLKQLLTLMQVSGEQVLELVFVI